MHSLLWLLCSPIWGLCRLRPATQKRVFKLCRIFQSLRVLPLPSVSSNSFPPLRVTWQRQGKHPPPQLSSCCCKEKTSLSKQHLFCQLQIAAFLIIRPSRQVYFLKMWRLWNKNGSKWRPQVMSVVSWQILCPACCCLTQKLVKVELPGLRWPCGTKSWEPQKYR